MPIDCGNNGACHGWPNPCTASMPKISGTWSREFLMVYCWIMLYSLAQSYPVLPTPPPPVVSIGLLVPPASTDPTCCCTRIFCIQAGLGMLNPLSPQAAPLGSVRVVTSCWSIWPTFSSSVIAWRSELTRAEIGLLALSHGADVDAFSALPLLARAGRPTPTAVTSPTAVTTAVSANNTFLVRVGRLPERKMDITRPPRVTADEALSSDAGSGGARPARSAPGICARAAVDGGGADGGEGRTRPCVRHCFMQRTTPHGAMVR